MKTSLKNRLRIISNHFAIITSHPVKKGIHVGDEERGPHSSSDRDARIYRLAVLFVKKKIKIWSFHVEVVQGRAAKKCTCRIVVLLTATIISFWRCRCIRRRSFVRSLISLSKTREVVGSLSKDVFLATDSNHVNQKRGLFPFNMPQRYQI